MLETVPKVRLIQSPQIHPEALAEIMADLDFMYGDSSDGKSAFEWLNRIEAMLITGEITDAEAVTEFAGRRCYRSFSVGLNPNVTQVRESSPAYFESIKSSAHGSVMEHAQFTFDFDQVSRVFTHELVRHRVGIAISQESLRYVRLQSLGFRIPPALEPHRSSVIDMVERLEEFQVEMAEAAGLDDEGVPFAVKKEVTSALRRLAPLGLSTAMVWSANVRTLRWLLQLRTAESAEEEIRLVFHDVGNLLIEQQPLFFGDFFPEAVPGSSIPKWVTPYPKV